MANAGLSVGRVGVGVVLVVLAVLLVPVLIAGGWYWYQLDPPGDPGRAVSVTIPSGEVKLNNEFTLTSAGTTITLDFDGDQSVRQTGSGNGNGNGNGNGANGRYMMSPVIRVVSVQ